jgi:formylglycine-generating enzyme required for sulfatase activity
MEFVLIPVGEFQMGSNQMGSNQMGSNYSDTLDNYDNEKPVHTVHLTQPFYLGKYEVTQGQWQAVMGNNPSAFKGDANLPVEQVSWDDVQEFMRRLNGREGGATYRLPTEAEWEYAARAGSTTAYSFGNDARLLGEYAWYNGNAGGTTHPVGQKKPNAWGLHDMHGNVWEWVQDWHGTYPSGTVTDPVGPSSYFPPQSVYRGGGWLYTARSCRSASRSGAPTGFRNDGLGFRLLRMAP